jgi:hypothetical protein
MTKDQKKTYYTSSGIECRCKRCCDFAKRLLEQSAKYMQKTKARYGIKKIRNN